MKETTEINKVQTLISILLLMLIILPITFNLLVLSQAQGSSTIYLTQDSITWVYLGPINISYYVNGFEIILKPTNGVINYSLNLALRMPLNINIKLSVDIVGGERIYYQINNVLMINDKSFGNGKLNESIEGNINIDQNDIILQWYKHEVRVPLRSNTSYVIIPLRKELENIISNARYSYIKKIDGFYTSEQVKDVQRASFYLYDVYINKSNYFNSMFKNNDNLCKVLDQLPMRTSIDLTINSFTERTNVRLSIQGFDLEDPIKAYQGYLCILPLLIELQKILVNTNISYIHTIDLLNIFTSLFSTINQRFIINTLNMYAYISNFIAKEHIDLIDSQILFNYRLRDNQSLILTISNTKIYNYNITEIKMLLKDLINIVAQNIEIYLYGNINNIIDESFIEISNGYITTSSTPMNIKYNLQTILVFIIIAISIQTGIIIYMMLKIISMKHTK
jgi:hypothetical protein